MLDFILDMATEDNYDEFPPPPNAKARCPELEESSGASFDDAK